MRSAFGHRNTYYGNLWESNSESILIKSSTESSIYELIKSSIYDFNSLFFVLISLNVIVEFRVRANGKIVALVAKADRYYDLQLCT